MHFFSVVVDTNKHFGTCNSGTTFTNNALINTHSVTLTIIYSALCYIKRKLSSVAPIPNLGQR